MTDYIVGSLSQSLLNGNVLDKDLDDIFKKSAGPAKFPAITAPLAQTRRKSDQDDTFPEQPFKSNNSPQRNKPLLEENYAAAKLRQAIMKSRMVEGFLNNAVQKHTKATKRKAEDGRINLKYIKKKVRKQEAHYEMKDERNGENEIEESEDSMVQDLSENEIRGSDIRINRNKTGAKLNINDDGEADVKSASKISISRDDEEKQKLERTIFVGNLPIAAISKAGFKSLSSKFKEFGSIQSIRFRSIAFSELLPRKAAFVTGKLHPDRDVVNAYIVYTNKGDAAKAILHMNAKEFLNKHVRVDWATNSKNHDRERSIFIGNLAFEAQEEDLWKIFDSCGKIENVRIVRDSKTNVGKGFAYVQFKDRASIDLALKFNGIKLGTQKLRVQYCTISKSVGASKDSKTTKDADIASPMVNQRTKLKLAVNSSNAKRRLLKKKFFKAPVPTAAFEGIRAIKSSVRMGRSEKREKNFKKHSAGAKSHKKKNAKL